MFRLFFISLLVLLPLFADDKVKIYASSMHTEENIVIADNGITVLYEDYILTAQKAKYNKESGDLELFEDIRVTKGSSYKILGKYAKLNIAKKERYFKPFYMLDRESELWLSADEGEIKAKDVDVTSGTLSGCDPVDPIWTIDFTSTDYNTESKWMNVYNARIYIKDIPVIYTPYFGYSLDTTRRTGLLLPQLGFSVNEGVYYEQPFYIAEQNWWDLELRPQVRTNRGEGLYSEFRFVDTALSKGEIRGGYFKEKRPYFLQNRLQNDSHYGYSVKYDSKDFVNQWFKTNYEGQSGIYIDAGYMNDVDYINLSSNNVENQYTSSQILSRANIFYNTDNHYFGTYLKYYQDLTLASNDNTLQKLPTLHYHTYMSTFFKDHLLYSLDAQSTNVQRNINTNAVQTDINLPVTLQSAFFDEYLNLSYKANLYMQHSAFRGEEEIIRPYVIYEDGYFARNNHALSASTQLTRAYEEVSHVIGFGVRYNKYGNDKKTGFYEHYADLNATAQNEYDLYSLLDMQDSLQIDFVQYLYNTKAEQILFHRVAQNIAKEKHDPLQQNTSGIGELENELELRVTSYLSLYNNMFYNYDTSKLSKIFNTLSFNKYGANLSFSHLYKDTFQETINQALPRYTSYLTSNATYEYNKNYSFSALYNYDIESKEQKSASIGFLYKKRCWDFGLRYAQNRRPILINNGSADFIDDRFIYLTLVLKPLMKQTSANASFISYRLPETKER